MADLIMQTDWSTFDTAKGRCSLYWTETTNQQENTSKLDYSLIMDTQPVTYYRTLKSGTLNIAGTEISLPTNKKYYNGNIISSGTITVNHEKNGEKTITTSLTVNIGGDIRTANAEVTLTKINRENDFAIDPTYTIGANVTIDVTKHNENYRSEIYYVINGVTYILVAKESESSVDTSFTLYYQDLKEKIGEYSTTVATIACMTYNEDATELIGTKLFYVTVSTGVIPISAYDDRAGNVGVSFGCEASRADIYSILPMTFESNGKSNIKFIDTTVNKSMNIGMSADGQNYGIYSNTTSKWIIQNDGTENGTVVDTKYINTWSGVCRSGSTISCTIPLDAKSVVMYWKIGDYWSCLTMYRGATGKHIVSDDINYAGGQISYNGETMTYTGTAQNNNNCYLGEIWYKKG
ncbi:MAG: hypothetical protein Q4C64_06755 [Erysipelotrichia bacterium]|nr:hypothetical protein [Erysipelotrichia bacterium]